MVWSLIYIYFFWWIEKKNKLCSCHTASRNPSNFKHSKGSFFSCISVVSVAVKQGERDSKYCLKLHLLWISVHWCWNKYNSSIRHRKWTLTRNSQEQWLRPCQILSRGYSLTEESFIHLLWRCWPSCWPCEHPFQTLEERDHPSADLLRIFMTG